MLRGENDSNVKPVELVADLGNAQLGYRLYARQTKRVYFIT